jgi:hypothetical protein
MTIALIVGQLLHVSYFENGSGTIEDKQNPMSKRDYYKAYPPYPSTQNKFQSL